MDWVDWVMAVGIIVVFTAVVALCIYLIHRAEVLTAENIAQGKRILSLHEELHAAVYAKEGTDGSRSMGSAGRESKLSASSGGALGPADSQPGEDAVLPGVREPAGRIGKHAILEVPEGLCRDHAHVAERSASGDGDRSTRSGSTTSDASD